MTKKYFYIVPLLLLEAMIQVGFFWLAPMCECRWVVYSFLTAMTVVHFTITFVLISQYGVRRGTATVVAGSIIQVIIIGTSVLLLTALASVRNALFLMTILTIFYIAIVAFFWMSIENNSDEMTHANIKRPHIFRNNYDDYDESVCCEEVMYHMNSQPVQGKLLGTDSANNFSNQSSDRSTPPPIPAKH